MFYYITGNNHKKEIAARYLPRLGVAYEVLSLPIEEIQSANAEAVALAKAEAAFEQVRKPILVNDHGWSIPGLNGFPGAYMKYMNEWLSPHDFLQLTKDLIDRRIILTEIICYKDSEVTKTFTKEHVGELLKEIQGSTPPAMTITCLTNDGIAAAEKIANHEVAFDEYPIWEEFATWYKHKK